MSGKIDTQPQASLGSIAQQAEEQASISSAGKKGGTSPTREQSCWERGIAFSQSIFDIPKANPTNLQKAKLLPKYLMAVFASAGFLLQKGFIAILVAVFTLSDKLLPPRHATSLSAQFEAGEKDGQIALIEFLEGKGSIRVGGNYRNANQIITKEPLATFEEAAGWLFPAENLADISLSAPQLGEKAAQAIMNSTQALSRMLDASYAVLRHAGLLSSSHPTDETKKALQEKLKDKDFLLLLQQPLNSLNSLLRLSDSSDNPQLNAVLRLVIRNVSVLAFHVLDARSSAGAQPREIRTKTEFMTLCDEALSALNEDSTKF